MGRGTHEADQPPAELVPLITKILAEGWTVRDAVVALRRADPNVRGATMARWLGTSREIVSRRLKELGLDTRGQGEARGGVRKKELTKYGGRSIV